MLQPFKGTILFQSGNKLIKGFPGYLNNLISNEYQNNSESIKADILSLVNKNIRESTGQSSVRESIQIGDIESYFIEKNNESFTIIITIPNNSLKFWVTTPDLNVFGVAIGVSGDFDLGFVATWEMKISLSLIVGNTFENIYIKNTIPAIQLKIAGNNIPGKLIEVIAKIINQVENIFNDKGFLDNLKNIQIPGNSLTEKLNEQLKNLHQLIPEFTNEFSIDGNNIIETKLNQGGSIIINHPWSQSGYTKRSAGENAGTVADSPSSTLQYQSDGNKLPDMDKKRYH